MFEDSEVGVAEGEEFVKFEKMWLGFVSVSEIALDVADIAFVL